MIAFLTSSPGGSYIENGERIPCELDQSNNFVNNLRKYWKVHPRCLMISSDPDNTAMNEGMKAIMTEAFSRSGLPFLECQICDSRNCDMSREEMLAYDVLILSGGHVPTQNAFFHKIQLKEKLKDFDGIIIGISAGSMNSSSIVYAQPELEGESDDPAYERFLDGLGLTDITILPHYQELKDAVLDGKRVIEDITLEDSIGRKIYALVDGSYVIVSGGETRFYGEAYLIEDGKISPISGDFSGYELSQDIGTALWLAGYEQPTRIQEEVIPVMLAGKNVIAKAPTGSGKTAAFAIPLCERVSWEGRYPQALVLEPTRELTDQVKEEIFYIGRRKRLKVPALFGGFPIDKQIQTLRQKSHIVVGTPGRVMDHIRRGSLKLDEITTLIIDEADLMLDMGFVDDMKAIIAALPENCGISLFSATLKPEIRELADVCIKDAELVIQEQDEENTPDIIQKLYAVEAEDKYRVLINVLMHENPESCLIFCGTKEMVHVLFRKLRKNRIFCGMLHGDMEQKERLKTVDAFRRGGFRFLIATDVAARGIDFPQITHVINYDFPTGRETYVHRIGRTGRNGKSGTAISLVGADDRQMLRMTAEYTGWELPVSEPPGRNEEEEKQFWQFQREKVKTEPSKRADLNKGISRISIGGGRKSKMRTCEIVATICSIDGIEAEDIGIIDIRDSISYVEILNQKGKMVYEGLQTKTIKGKRRKVKLARS